MKKILYIVSTLKKSGPTNQLFNIISNLDRTGFEPILVSLSPETKDSKWRDYEVLGIEMHSLNLSRLEGLFFAKSKLKSLLNKLKPNLIHTQGIRADGLSASMKLNTPKVATIRNFPQIDFPMTYGRILGAWMVWRQTRALRKLNLSVGVSKAVKLNLEAKFNLSNTSVVQNGVDTVAYHAVTVRKKSELRVKLGLPVENIVWVVSGHLSERKDPLFLIKIWHKVLDFDKNNTLVFIGGGVLEQDCKIQAGQLDSVKVLGRVNNVNEYLMASDFYVSSSVAEGLPNAALEAMACGLPVLLSDIEPHKEIFEMNANIGALFKLGDEASFLQSFKSLVGSDYYTQRKAAQDLIESDLSAVKMS